MGLNVWWQVERAASTAEHWERLIYRGTKAGVVNIKDFIVCESAQTIAQVDDLIAAELGQ
jgi:hypothetical protein